MLVQRKAQELGAQLALVTLDPEVSVNARELGIPVFRSAKLAQKAVWSRPGHKKAFQPRANWRPAAPDVLRARQAELYPRVKAGTARLILRIAVFVTGILAFFLLAFFFYPSGKIIFSPVEEEQVFELSLWASPNFAMVNPAGGIPARVESVEVATHVEGKSSGTMQSPQSYASGLVLLTNLTPNAVELPAGVVLQTTGAAPIRFETTDVVQLPGGAGESVEVMVRALVPGSGGNVLPGAIAAIEGSSGLSVSVTNRTALAGGGEATVRTPSMSDVVEMEAQLNLALKKAALEAFGNSLSSGEFVLPVSLQQIRIVEESREPAEGQPGDLLKMSRRALISGWVVRDADIQTAAQTALNASMRTGFHPLEGSLTLEPDGDAVKDDNFVQWKLRARQRIQADWSRDQVLGLVRGKTPAAAADALRSVILLDGDAEITMNPEWWLWLPFLPFRISLEAQ